MFHDTTATATGGLARTSTSLWQALAALAEPTTAPVPSAGESVDPAGGAATTGSGRVGNVDVLRAVAAFAILTVHAYGLGGRSVPVRAQFGYDVLLHALTSGVFLFFAISGYVISKPFVDRLLAGRPLPELVPYALRRGFRIFPCTGSPSPPSSASRAS